MTEPPGRTAAGPGSGSARPSLPAYRLVRPLLPPAETAPALDDAQRCVVEHAGGPLLVLAGPGTGKTTTVVESVVDRIERRGRDPDSILVLTFSRRAAGELRSRITARLGRTVREPIARTFHSYAFGVLRMRAVAAGGPPPRLLAGPEQDVVIRELLEGDALAGGAGWPAALRPALRTRGFAAELRDLLMRAIERDVDADDLAAYGERFGRPEWGAAAGFLHQYRGVGALARANAYDPAELIRAALDAFDDDPELLAAEQRRRRVVFVDEYQDTDPAQEQLLRRLCAGADELVVVGDPDQSIYAFRGADPTAIRRFPDVFARAGRSPAPTVALTTSNRAGTALLLASRRIAGRLGGPAAHRVLQPAAGRAPGRLDVAVLATGSEEAAYIANRLREAHLREHVAWGDMAVLVRSTVRTLPQLRRALASAGVPVQVAGDDLPLAAQPLVASFLLLLRCAGGGSVDPPDAIELLGSQFGRADALAARRLRRELLRIDGEAGGRSRSDALLAQALTDPGLLGQVRERIARPATRVARLLTAAREQMIAPASVEDVLWSVWSASGLPARLEGIVRRGGPAADIADRDLDAAVALFDAAARFVDQLPPGTDVRSFIESLAGQQIPGDTLAPASRTGDRVRVLTAHAAKGLQWPLVVVAGVQEGSWPDLRRRGSVLGSEVLVDVAGGHDPQVVSALGPLLTEERRLFYVAITRASRALLVTAVQGDDETPSRFLAEIDPRSAGDDRQPQVIRRFFALPAIVAEMRSAVTDPAAPMPRREAAARGLARLAAAGVRGADPAGWWGLAPISDDAPLLPGSDPVRVSASQVQKFADCQLRWFLEGAGAASAASVSQSLGVILHALAEAAVTEGLDDDALRARLDDALDDIERDLGPPWRLDRERRDAHTKLDKLLGWLHARTDDVEVVGVELPFDLQVDRAHLTGRVDRLERHDGATLVVVDFKTGSGSGKPTGEKLARFPQLGIYQLAVTGGGFAEVDDSRSSGGASLVYLGGTAKASEPRQRALAEDPDPDWARALAADTADGMGGSVFLATPSTQCRLCAARYCCPSVLVGRQVGGDDR